MLHGRYKLKTHPPPSVVNVDVLRVHNAQLFEGVLRVLGVYNVSDVLENLDRVDRLTLFVVVKERWTNSRDDCGPGLDAGGWVDQFHPCVADMSCITKFVRASTSLGSEFT